MYVAQRNYFSHVSYLPSKAFLFQFFSVSLHCKEDEWIHWSLSSSTIFQSAVNLSKKDNNGYEFCLQTITMLQFNYRIFCILSLYCLQLGIEWIWDNQNWKKSAAKLCLACKTARGRLKFRKNKIPRPALFLQARDSETLVQDTKISRLTKNLPRNIIFQGLFYISNFWLIFLLTSADFASFLNTNFIILSFSSDWTQEIPRSHSLTNNSEPLIINYSNCMGQIIHKEMWGEGQYICTLQNKMTWND